MAYIGIQPAEKFTSFATQEFSTSATTSYTLDHAVANENEIALFVNNVSQQPGSGKAYTATGTALTLSAATASTDTMYCVFLGRALQTVTPATNSITAAMVGNDLISGKDALTSSPADTDELLISDAGVLKRIDVSLVGGKNTPSFSAVVSSDTSLGTSKTLVPFDVELHDSDDCYTNTSGNYKFTPNVAGKYFIGANMYGFGLQDQNQVFWSLHFNGSQATYNANWVSSSASNRAIGSFVGAVLEFNGSSDYVQAYVESGSNAFTIDNGSYASTSVYTKQLSASNFFGYKLIGV